MSASQMKRLEAHGTLRTIAVEPGNSAGDVVLVAGMGVPIDSGIGAGRNHNDRARRSP
jgi:hypothetical protein